MARTQGENEMKIKELESYWGSEVEVECLNKIINIINKYDFTEEEVTKITEHAEEIRNVAVGKAEELWGDDL